MKQWNWGSFQFEWFERKWCGKKQRERWGRKTMNPNFLNENFIAFIIPTIKRIFSNILKLSLAMQLQENNELNANMRKPLSRCVPASALHTPNDPNYTRCEQRVFASQHTWFHCCSYQLRTVECHLRSHSNNSSTECAYRAIAIYLLKFVCRVRGVSGALEASLHNKGSNE